MLTVPTCNMVLVSSQAKSISCDMHSENIHNFMPKMFCSSFDFCLSKSSVLVSAIVIPDLLLTVPVTKNQFSYFSTKTYVVGAKKNCLNEMVLLNTQNISLKLMGKKIFTILRSKILFVN